MKRNLDSESLKNFEPSHLCNTGKSAFKSAQVFILGEKPNKKIFLLHCNYCPNF